MSAMGSSGNLWSIYEKGRQIKFCLPFFVVLCYTRYRFSQNKVIKKKRQRDDTCMVNPKLKDELNDQLCRAIMCLDDLDECYQFFEDICTVSELKAMAQRLEVARMLREGHTYDEIVDRTGASTATISRVKRCLNYGADGYRIVLERLAKETD